ncbi:MAG: thioredoxin family protein [bacterium]|nr:thioredoxin family protein [bacterium]
MALLNSQPRALGSDAPDFTLPDTVSGDQVSLASLKNERGVAILFICNHCPYVVHIEDELVRVGREYTERGMKFAAISANDFVRYPDDAPDKMKARAEAKGFPFPYLVDEDQSVARSYAAACTPELFVYDANLKLYYHGQFDDTRPGQGVANGKDFRAALDRLLAGEQPPENQKPSIGCSIKWK